MIFLFSSNSLNASPTPSLPPQKKKKLNYSLKPHDQLKSSWNNVNKKTIEHFQLWGCEEKPQVQIGIVMQVTGHRS